MERAHVDLSNKEEIQELLSSLSAAKIKAVLESLKVKRAPIHRDPLKMPGPVKQYVKVVKNYTCLACDSTFTYEYKMEKGEEISTINKDGTASTLIIAKDDGALTISCFCTKCEHCATKASMWSREELESRWLSLVRSMSFKEVRMKK